jgi:hypothetical protein
MEYKTMKTQNNNHIRSWLVLAATTFILVGCVVGHAQTIDSFTTFLPIVSSPPGQVPIFGVEVTSLDSTKVLSSAADANTYWLRRNGLLWSDVQPDNPNQWNWPDDTSLAQDLIKANNNGMKVILIVRGAPGWAQEYPGFPCGPIKPEMIGNFANFMAQVVNHYSVPPYEVMYYEIWNEPDVDHNVKNPNQPFGCWGEKEDYYYGGGAYAHMLEAIYPVMKTANPDVQVVLGGLLLDCDPANPGTFGYCRTDEAAKAPRFFEGILRAGGGNYFDILSFHGYPSYSSQYPHPIDNELNFEVWKARGGLVQGKKNYLRELMATYSVNKPIIHTEGALLIVPPEQTSAVFEEAKADYAVWLFARNMSEGILGTIWFKLDGPGWRDSSMLDLNQDPRPAYNTYKFMEQELRNSKYISKHSNTPGVVEFIFASTNKDIHIYVPIDGNSHTLTTPVGQLTLYDKYGNLLPQPGTTFTIIHPVYLEIGK